MRLIRSGTPARFGYWFRRSVVLCIAFGLVSCGGGATQGVSTNQAMHAALTAVPTPGVTVTGITKVSETRVSRTVFDYVFNVTVKNNDTVPYGGVTATLTGVGAGTTIIDGTVQVGNLAAGQTFIPQDTITLRQDRTVLFNSSALVWNVTSTVTSRPGLVLTQCLDVAQGGSAVIALPGNALNGTVITIPPNALGTTGTDCISIGYSDILPGPIDPDAVAAGAKVISRTVELTHTSADPFAAALQVTVPYDKTLVGEYGVPIALYWDEELGKYQSLQVVGIDRANGTVTFNTKHFTPIAIMFFDFNLQVALNDGPQFLLAAGQISVPAVKGFSPDADGFSVRNFSTQSSVVNNPLYGSGGVCYGLTSFAAWYFDKRHASQNGSSPLTPLFGNYFGSTSSYAASNPIEQDAARELIYNTYIDTYKDNLSAFTFPIYAGPQYMPIEVVDQVTAVTLIETLLLTKSPQLLELHQNKEYPTGTWNNGMFTPIWHDGVRHSVLVYGYNPPSGNNFGSFLIYDPNYPNTLKPIYWDTSDGTFVPYESIDNNIIYTLFTYDAYSSHYNTELLAANLTQAKSGWPKKAFNNIPDISRVTFMLGKSAKDYPVNTYAIDPSGHIIINGSVVTSDAHTVPSKPSSAYFYLDGIYSGSSPITNGHFSTDNLVLPSLQSSAELVIIVAEVGGNGTQSYPGISKGYAGFLRAKINQLYSVVEIIPPLRDPPLSLIGMSINDDGWVSGFAASHNGNININEAFVYNPNSGQLSFGPVPPSTVSVSEETGRSINSSGQVLLIMARTIALSGLPADDTVYANHIGTFIWDTVSDSYTDIGDVYYWGNTLGYSINNSGQVTGVGFNSIAGFSLYEAGFESQNMYSMNPDPDMDHRTAFVYTPGVGIAAIPGLGGKNSEGLSINNLGQVTGWSSLAGNSSVHAFIYSSGSVDLIDIGTLGGNISSGFSINDKGEVTGWSLLSDNVTWHAFKYTPSTGMVDIDAFGQSSTGRSINYSGAVVGAAYFVGSELPLNNAGGAAYIGSVDLNQLIVPTLGIYLSGAMSINNKGQILANDGFRTFILTPIKSK